MTQWNIHWHERDLRIHDNPALTEAAKGNLLPLFIYSPHEEKEWARGGASKWWLHHSLKELAAEYRALGRELIIRCGPVEKVMKEILSSLDVSGVYWNRRHEPHWAFRDQQISRFLEAENVKVVKEEGNYLVSPEAIYNQSGKPYAVFTPFSKAVLRHGGWRQPLPPIGEGVKSPLVSLPLEDLNLLPQLDWAKGFSSRWQPGRKGAMSHLAQFDEKVLAYRERRDFPADFGTSRLSPHLHFGELSPNEVWQFFDGKGEKAEPYMRQLLWREFGNSFLFHTPLATHEPWKKNFAHFPWEEDGAALWAWQKGMTGYPIVDAGMRELWQTGWMHNRVRMIVGSFLVKDLFIPWQEGAKWFWDTLVDADLANNTLGWQWIAGCGPDAAPYFRIFNPVLQSQKFDPDGQYIRRWIPELKSVPKKWIHAPWEMPLAAPDYSPPIVDHGEARKKALASYQKIKGE